MKAMRLFLIVVCFLFNVSYLMSTPVITNVVTTPTNSVELYDKLEITFNMNDYTNPYDPDIINSYCEFWSPSGKYYKVFAFYYQHYTKTNSNCTPYPCENLIPTVISNWKVRFTPNEEGSWRYKITAIDNSGSIIYPRFGTLSYTCTPSLNEGFIVKANNEFLKRTTGEFFFPVGQNVAWYNSPIYWWVQTYGANEYKAYIDSISNNKSNFIRVWLDRYEGMALVGWDFTTQQNYFDLYNQKDAFQLDWIFNYASTKGVNIVLCFFAHSSWGDSSVGQNTWTERNPFNVNNGCPLTTPFKFFSNSDAIYRTKNLLKYIVSIWGYCTNLVAWELWNEVDKMLEVNSNLVPPVTFESDVLNWHRVIYNYIKTIDPHQHLITTSFAGGVDDSNRSVFSIMDYTQSHDYKDPTTNLTDDFQNHFYAVAKYSIDTMNKPYMNGEWGLDAPETWNEVDPNGFELHNSLWSSAFSTALGAVSNWWWDRYMMQQDLFGHFKPVSEFMNSLPVPSELFYPFKLTNNGLRVYYMANSNNDTIYGWTQDNNFHFQSLRLTAFGNTYLQTLNPDKRPFPSSENNEITIPINQNNKQYIVKWYSAETCDEIQQDTVISSNNCLKIYIPISLRTSTFGDAVFAIYLDCDKYLWQEEPLNNNTYHNVSGNVVCNKINGQVFYKTLDNKLNNIWCNSSGVWNWSGLDNATNNNVYSGNLAADNLGNVFFRSSDNTIHRISYKSQCEYNTLAKLQKKYLIANYNENIYFDEFIGNIESEISVFPNPTNYAINILSKDIIDKVYVYNIDGRLIKKMQCKCK